MIFLGSGKKTLVIADEGARLRGVVADSRQLHTATVFPAATPLENILEFGRKQGAGRLLFLTFADIRELEVKLTSALDADERLSAVEYAADLNSDPEQGERLAFMEKLPGHFSTGVLAATFPTTDIVEQKSLAGTKKLKYSGMIGLQMLMLASHLSSGESNGEAFLLLLGDSGFAAIPHHRQLLLRNLPFGTPPANKEEALEWEARLHRRLSGLKNRRVRLYSPGADGEFAARLKDIVGAESVEIAPWEEAVAAAIVLWLGRGDQLIIPALPAAKPKDPKASGTFIGLTIFGVAAFSMLYLGGHTFITLRAVQGDLSVKQAIEKQIKDEEAKLKKLEGELAAAREINRLLAHDEHVSANMLLVLNLLSRYKLEYTKITAIEERTTGIHISGETVWQPDLSRFFSHLEGELAERNLALFSDGISHRGDNKIEFRAHIAPGN